jgi:hypothetical protein
VQCSRKRIAFSTFCAGTGGSCPQIVLGSILQYILLHTKMNSNWIIYLNTQSETTKVPGENLSNILLTEDFLDMTQKSKFIIGQT